MVFKYPYFVQNPDWVSFWVKANNKLNPSKIHKSYYFENNLLETQVFEYPFWLGKKFWYISKGPVFKKEIDLNKLYNDSEYVDKQTQNAFIELIKTIYNKAKAEKIAFIKFDFDDSLSEQMNCQSLSEYKLLLESVNLDPRISSRKIQFLTSTYNFIDWSKGKSEIKTDTLFNFYNSTIDIFWSKCNEKIRRYTRKVLNLKNEKNESFWLVDTEKSALNFEKFYQIHIETTKRQNFPTQPRAYLEELFYQDFNKIIIISDQNGTPHCVWLGILLNHQLVYLLGGNTDLAFKNWAQYLVHVKALEICYKNGICFYDMGGYDAEAGYGQFKDGYKGEKRVFIGVLDIVISSWYYFIVQIINQIKKYR
jgi:lipid II:glycine glycyltransferase (peptidoglycan interpeptide bridge formation enzyme)